MFILDSSQFIQIPIKLIKPVNTCSFSSGFCYHSLSTSWWSIHQHT